MATASNIGSAGTIIGNPQNILIGSLSGIPFIYYLKVAFPLVVLGLLLNYLILVLAYREESRGLLALNPSTEGVRHKYLMSKSLAATACVFAGLLAGANAAVVASLGAAYLLFTRRLKPNKIYDFTEGRVNGDHEDGGVGMRQIGICRVCIMLVNRADTRCVHQDHTLL